ncbi:hypothetical protein K488DRAFT_86237 [Vararia minispora EC-137]|uniref:Uncharacterized protein n=1 Tax=Vararia minispora EC-137 TaxID=1314806 RepID=A0ACB8QKX9_9AGAM|nr:hypothetical protein K488DRAFT_86237 [Vararia minispora EC-137]
MFLLFFAASVATVLLFLLRMPAFWSSLMALDEPSDVHEMGMALVATRNPFRESGPPACMAKLIMLRHKLNQSNARKQRRSPSPARQYSRPRPTVRPAAVPWIRTQHRGRITHY